MRDLNRLKLVTSRLNTVPVTDLPRIASFLASSISSCSDILSSPRGNSGNRNDDATLEVHKLKTRLSSLLREKTPQGRFTAVVLIKATVEAGGREILQDCDSFLRGLLAILNRPDPTTSKKLCLVLITRILSLTRQHPSLVREITTPILPSFITACTKLGGLNQPHEHLRLPFQPNPFLDTVLQVLLELLPHHPSTFRPFVSKLEPNLARLIGGLLCPDSTSQLATSLFVSLYICAPGNTAATEWLNVSNAAIKSAHQIGDQIFRAVIEDWRPAEGGHQKLSAHGSFAETPRSQDNDPLHFASWRGVYEGSRVLSRVLGLLSALIQQPTPCPVDIPLGQILDLTSRFLCLRLPSKSHGDQDGMQINPEIFQDEREELFSLITTIHEWTLRLLLSVAETFGIGILASCQTILDQCVGTLDPQISPVEVRLVTYGLTEKIVHSIGPSMTKQEFKATGPIIQSCCNDLDFHKKHEAVIAAQASANVNGNADSFLEKSKKPTTNIQTKSPLSDAASSLLRAVLQYVPAQSIPHSIRTQIDRLAIINGSTITMLASILNPPSKSSGKAVSPSILPFLARTSQGEVEVEGLLRPRVPVIRTQMLQSADNGGLEEDEDVGVNGFEETQITTDQLQSEQVHGLEFADPIKYGIGDVQIPSRFQSQPSPGPSLKPAEQVPQSADFSETSVDGAINGTQEAGAGQSLKRALEGANPPQPENSKRVRNLSPMPPVEGPSQELVVDNISDTHHEMSSTFVTNMGENAKGKAVGHDAAGSGSAKDTLDPVVSEDESDFEMPPIYLKTDSEDEGDDDDEMGNGDDQEGKI